MDAPPVRRVSAFFASHTEVEIAEDGEGYGDEG